MTNTDREWGDWKAKVGEMEGIAMGLRMIDREAAASAIDAFLSEANARLDAAEAERERLARALREIADAVDADRYADKGAIWCGDVARQALEEGAK